MLFTTFTYFIFLIFVFFCFWTLRGVSARNLVLLSSSFLFYAWWDYRFASLILLSGSIDYAVGLMLSDLKNKTFRKILLFLSVAINLLILVIFKYSNFFLENLIIMLNTIGIDSLSKIDLQIILPIGISFYTLQTMSYTIDVYKKKIKATNNFVAYMCYVSFFPQLVSGPIERAGNLLPQFLIHQIFDMKEATEGLRQILWGFFKKAIIANNIGLLVDNCYSSPETMSSAALLSATILFSFQIYCDFSGYSDIAIGTAKLFNIKLSKNFLYPYFAKNLNEFWRRWHISLSTWFRDYVYIPLGGNQLGKRKQTAAIFVTFLLSGLWHGASWNFLLWAIVCVAPLIFIINLKSKLTWKVRIFSDKHSVRICTTLLSIFLTYSYVCFSWIFFRSETPQKAWIIIKRIFSGHPTEISQIEMMDDLLISMAAVTIFAILEFMCRRKNYPLEYLGWPQSIRWLLYTIMTGLIICFGFKSNEPFIYFRF